MPLSVFQVLLKANLIFSPVYSRTFQACANPDKYKNKNC